MSGGAGFLPSTVLIRNNKRAFKIRGKQQLKDLQRKLECPESFLLDFQIDANKTQFNTTGFLTCWSLVHNQDLNYYSTHVISSTHLILVFQKSSNRTEVQTHKTWQTQRGETISNGNSWECCDFFCQKKSAQSIQAIQNEMYWKNRLGANNISSVFG